MPLPPVRGSVVASFLWGVSPTVQRLAKATDPFDPAQVEELHKTLMNEFQDLLSRALINRKVAGRVTSLRFVRALASTIDWRRVIRMLGTKFSVVRRVTPVPPLNYEASVVNLMKIIIMRSLEDRLREERERYVKDIGNRMAAIKSFAEALRDEFKKEFMRAIILELRVGYSKARVFVTEVSNSINWAKVSKAFLDSSFLDR